MRSVDLNQTLFYQYRGFNRATFFKSLIEAKRFYQTLRSNGEDIDTSTAVEEASNSTPINNHILFPSVFLNQTNEPKELFASYNSAENYQQFSAFFEKYHQIDTYA